MIDCNLLLFARDGTIARRLTAGDCARRRRYDHCNMTAGPHADPTALKRFAELLLAMSYADTAVRPLLDLEGLKQWLPGRTSGYAQLERAVEQTGFYDPRRPARCRRLPTLTTSGWTRAVICCLSAPSPRCERRRPAGRSPAATRPWPCICASWCRRRRPPVPRSEGAGLPSSRRARAERDRWRDAVRAGDAAHRRSARADPSWGLAARGALVESGGPALNADLVRPRLVWAQILPRGCTRARQPASGIPTRPSTGTPPFTLPPDVEAAVVQVMTYLVENEQAALLVPGRLLARIHPHFREVMQFLASRPRTRRATSRSSPGGRCCTGGELGVSGAGGRASLHTLLRRARFHARRLPALRARRGKLS